MCHPEVLVTNSGYTCQGKVAPEGENCLGEQVLLSARSFDLSPHHLCSTVQQPTYDFLPHHHFLYPPNFHHHTVYPRIFRGYTTPVNSCSDGSYLHKIKLKRAKIFWVSENIASRDTVQEKRIWGNIPHLVFPFFIYQLFIFSF